MLHFPWSPSSYQRLDDILSSGLFHMLLQTRCTFLLLCGCCDASSIQPSWKPFLAEDVETILALCAGWKKWSRCRSPCIIASSKLNVTRDERLIKLDDLWFTFLLLLCFWVALHVLDTFFNFVSMILGAHSHVPESTFHLDDWVSHLISTTTMFSYLGCVNEDLDQFFNSWWRLLKYMALDQFWSDVNNVSLFVWIGDSLPVPLPTAWV